MSLKVLFVAEKNDTAKEISRIMSNNKYTRREGLSKLNKIYGFSCKMLNNDADITMASVSGHIMTIDFSLEFKSWEKHPPVSLFTAPIEDYCPEDSKPIVNTIVREAKENEMLVLWTDCDREGEYIASEIRHICLIANPSIKIYRARFSEITYASIHTAINQMEMINERLVAAVDCRKELDLRIGAAFTRFLSLRLQKVFPYHFPTNHVVSYGPCQFPTLGFVVDRCKQVEHFVPKKFYKLRTVVERGDTQVNFFWSRGGIQDRTETEQSQRGCNQQSVAIVYRVVSKSKSEPRPLPLNTVELEKKASRKLDMSAKQVMMIAEKLYTQGLISYPRTETNFFPPSFNLVPLVEEQTRAEQWGDTARHILRDSPTPSEGQKSDQAHPPIYPIKHTSSLQGNERKVYEFIARHFLACCHKDAQTSETTVEILVNKESFSASGLIITARNYLDVYPYDEWCDRRIPHFTQGERIQIEGCIEMIECETTPPSYLTEADLIQLMDEHGIGTDATHSDHIERIKMRGYVDVQLDGTLLPSKLGRGLVEGYTKIGHNLANSDLRAELERDLTDICVGKKEKNEVINFMVHRYKQVFTEISSHAILIDESLSNYFGPPKQLHIEYPHERDGIPNTPPRDIYSPLLPYDIHYFNQEFPEVEDYTKLLPHLPFEDSYNPFRNLLTGKRFTCEPSSPNKILRKDAIIECHCGEPAAFLTVMKGPDTGKKFFNCNSSSCGYFIWETDIDASIYLYLEPSSQLFDELVSKVGHDLLCHCGDRARLITERKEAPDKGRRFYECPKLYGQECNFFQWIDADQSDANTLTSILDDLKSNMSLRDSAHGVICYCGDSAKFLTVKKDSKNKGRNFYTCPKPTNQECGFFEWADELSQHNISSSSFSDSCQCHCGITAKSFTVKKDSPNKGRKFYTCPKPKVKECGFFQWADGDINFSTNVSSSHTANNEGIICQCELSAKVLTVTKESPNKGRTFYKCPKPRGQECEFFQWDDEDQINAATNNISFSYDGNSQGILCLCGRSATLFTVKKDSVNKGRQFYTCPKPKIQRCDYFQWADEDVTIAEHMSFDDNSQIVCQCGNSVKLFTVKKDSPNKGRQFYKCQKSKGHTCDFFKWADE
ncbi:DNA topoisomerase 3-alpha [Oopsacas minuta]|uniref:DNA topoisomerase n=1 Tax=Oopsacas minuta TaxID=111878 RepID=A0AAV7K5L6_9METZ|nr:DNA topoisomerase 3-alpha [Oopsacas minuta]